MAAPDREAVGAAVGFLTLLPVGRRAATPDALLRGAPLFPLVGAAIGAAVGGTAVVAGLALPPLMAGTIAVALELALTGALHFDGLADSADGLGGRDRDHSLAIMRDHALGAYGGAALVLVLLLEIAALGALAQAESWNAVPIVAAALALSRAAPLALAAALPYARPGDGTGRMLTERTGWTPALAAAAIAAAIAPVAGPDALALVAATAASTAAVGLLARRRLGGVTGDVMGAAIELSAATSLVVAVAG